MQILDKLRSLCCSCRLLLLMAMPLLMLLSLSGCATVGYYAQAVNGHLALMRARQPIQHLLEAEDTEPELRRKLELLIEARQYAVNRLQLPDNESYSTYVETGRRYVTWNVVAAPEFSVRAKTWCFPVAGCVSYKGYFDEADAKTYATTLSEAGLDTTVTGASAYSTLGWFEDPLLDTMMRGGDIRLVGTLFHELAHQVLYVKNDSSFNEAFASFVEQEGIRTWLRERGKQEAVSGYDAALQRQLGFISLLQKTRKKLVDLYQQDAPDDVQRRQLKSDIFTGMRDDYAVLKESWDGYSGYDGWFNRDINNAHLVAVSTYRRWIPAFAALFADSDMAFDQFYAAASELAELPAASRREQLQALMDGDRDSAADRRTE